MKSLLFYIEIPYACEKDIDSRVRKLLPHMRPRLTFKVFESPLTKTYNSIRKDFEILFRFHDDGDRGVASSQREPGGRKEIGLESLFDYFNNEN